VPGLPDSGSLPDQISDFIATTKAYALQETVDPLRRAKSYLLWGTAGASVGAIGIVMLLLAGLRALQTETGSHLTGNWSWVPYLIMLVVTVALLGLVISRIGKHELRTDHTRAGAKR
jgi:choline-glycine betaine transporter